METSRLSGDARRSSPARIIVVFAAIIIVVAGMAWAKSIFSPLLLSAFFAIVASPAVGALRRRGLPKWAAIGVTCLSVVGVGTLVFAAFFSMLTEFSEDLPMYQEELAAWANGIEQGLADLGIDLSSIHLFENLTGTSLLNVASSLIGSILDSLSSVFLLFLLTVFFIVDASVFSAIGKRQLGETDRRWLAITSFVDDLQRFFLIKSVENLIISGSMVILLLIFDIPYPFLWGILGFFLSYIPNIGLLLACIPPAMLALAIHGIPAALIIVIGVTIVNQVGDNVLLPMVAKKGLNMPLSIQFVSVVIWTWILGPAGAILALPLTMAVRLFLSMSRQSQPVGEWLSGPVVSRAAPAQPMVTASAEADSPNSG